MDELESRELAWPSYPIPARYLELPAAPRGAITPLEPLAPAGGAGGEEGIPYSRRPEHKTYVVAGVDIAAAIAAIGKPPAGRNGQWCLAYHVKGNCPNGSKCSRIRDHTATHPDDVFERTKWINKVRGLSA